MPFTRCNACGAKALLAASQCPKCSQWLGLRDDQGEMVPLARCRSCQCYYPRAQDACRCGAAAQPGPRGGSLVWGGLGVVVIAGVAWGAVRILGASGAPAPPRMTAMAMAVAQQPIAPPNDSGQPVQQDSTPSVPAMSTGADTLRPMPGNEGTARNWVNVRAGTGRDSEILGVIKPDTRVRFGNARGGWIRVSTPELRGWADRRLFSVVR